MCMWARGVKVQYASTCLYLYSTCKLIRSHQTVWCRGVSCTQNRIKRTRYSTPAWCFTQLIAPWRLKNTSQTFLVTEKQGIMLLWQQLLPSDHRLYAIIQHCHTWVPFFIPHVLICNCWLATIIALLQLLSSSINQSTELYTSIAIQLTWLLLSKVMSTLEGSRFDHIWAKFMRECRC